ncbi:hypothetical protein Tco_1041469 [Tanacetum coccineum]|uniref:Xylulose kinase-1 n=1 Tax=Tanacetum coccineum TaxID=301880 RepID=A0ABQ5GHB8_9ASTR
MATLKFADTHNMVAFLDKPAETKGFKQIVDFLNAHTIKYALTVNPTIYTSCIEQFWSSVKAKTINGEVQLQALVDGKKIIITESIVRRDLQLEDAKGVDCLPNATIFEQLTLMGSKTIAWNEFSSTMTSTIICLATNQKFNFSKYIFESMVKNLDNVSGKFLMYPRSRRSKRKDTEVPQPSGPTTNVADEAVNEEMDNSLERAATTDTGLEQSRTVTRFENVSKLPNDPLLAKVLALETTKTTQATKIASLKKRVKKLEMRNKSRTYGLKRLYKVSSSRRVESSEDKGLGEEDASKQGRIADIHANEDIYLVNVQTDEDMFGVNDLDGDEVIVKSVYVVNTAEETRSVVEEVTTITIPVSAAITTTTTTAITDVEMTLAQALAELKSAKPKATTITTTPTLTTTTTATTIIAVSTSPRAKGIVIHEQEQAPTLTFSSQQPSQVKVQDKGKGKMVEPEPVKKMSKKELLRLDEELAFKLQAEEEEEEERLAREKTQQMEEANIAWDDIQAKIDADYQLAQRLQAQKQDELTDEEKARLTELVEESSKKVEAEIAYESSLKRAGKELEQESSKKQKLEEEKESEELKQCLEIIPDDGNDVTIDAKPLSTKSPTIVDYKIYKEGKKTYFQIIKADGKTQMYLTFGKMLKNFDREDLEVLWSIVKARFKKTEPVNYMDNFLLLNLKTMFEQCRTWRIVGIKSLLEVTAAKVCITAAKQKNSIYEVGGIQQEVFLHPGDITVSSRSTRRNLAALTKDHKGNKINTPYLV